MLSPVTQTILTESRERGWVLEPDAKCIMRDAGLEVPEFHYGTTVDEILRSAHAIGYPLVAKVVSPKVLHKTEVRGVAVGVDSDPALKTVIERFQRIDGFAGVHVEKMVSGLELIVGAKIDAQFGPVILLGMGGTGVEIYQDVAIRMAPLSPSDVRSMLLSLRGRRLLEGYRGAEPVNKERLTRTLLAFSELVLDVQDLIESVDLNPVLCSDRACVVADARIVLRPHDSAITAPAPPSPPGPVSCRH
ncbi:MAG: acetate--CoA ligase family protein [Desulfosarcina sp.]